MSVSDSREHATEDRLDSEGRQRSAAHRLSLNAFSGRVVAIGAEVGLIPQRQAHHCEGAIRITPRGVVVEQRVSLLVGIVQRERAYDDQAIVVRDGEARSHARRRSTLRMAVLAPMPIASDNTATAVKPGLARSMRMP